MGKRTSNLAQGVLVFRNDALDVHRYQLSPAFLLNDDLTRASPGRSCYLFVGTTQETGRIVSLFLCEEDDNLPTPSGSAPRGLSHHPLFKDFPRAKVDREREISTEELREVHAHTIAALRNASRR